MKLTSRNGSQLGLSIVGYQFPDLATVPYDSNWLNICVRVVHPRGSWTATDPSLLTYEVARLADWLDAVARGARVEPEESFLEPNLRFELTHSSLEPSLRVYFDLESRPKWAPVDGAGNDDLYVEFPLEEIDLAGAAAILRKQLQAFPQRTPR